MQTITPEFLDELIDFSPPGKDRGKAFAAQQREGAVGVFNMLAKNGCAYLADEVGMGKTYVALGVMSLLRYLNPHARIVVIAPRQNIQRKWVKELQNFVRQNWRVVGNRVKSIHGSPVWPPTVCGSLAEFAHEAQVNQDRDFFLRMPSFSIRLSQSDDRQRTRLALLNSIPWLKLGDIPNRTPEGFRDAFAIALNGAIPEADLVVVDEAHNLKHGFHEDGSTRNRVMGLAFGHPDGQDWGQSWYRDKAKRVLLLSATPFEDDYGAIQRQLAVFGFGDKQLKDARDETSVSVSMLADPDVTDEEKQKVAQRILVRRVSGLKIAGKLHTKNMYRREWRRGGLEEHDQPIEITAPKQRLVVALMQKKVAEVLQSERFNNHFQIGMLSSFESFLESVETVSSRRGDSTTFDGEEQNRGLSEAERGGIDTLAIAEIVSSYREQFRSSLPHPKLDAVAETLSASFSSGEKTLVFVRRVATVSELAAKLDESFDNWIKSEMKSRLPHLRFEISRLFEQYANERLRGPTEMPHDDALVLSRERERIGRRVDLDDSDEGGKETFFAWFFRGAGPPNVLSGAAFQKNRLSSDSSAYATLFEDDYVASLLSVDNLDAVLKFLAQTTDQSMNQCQTQLRALAFEFFQTRSQRREGYPRLYVYEAYQAAGLTLIRRCGGELGEKSAVILEERFPHLQHGHTERKPPAGFPSAGLGLGLTTIFTELRRRPSLRELLWPSESRGRFRETFRWREQRRELIKAMSRLGAAYIDLYLIGVEPLKTLSQRQRQHPDAKTADEFAVDFVNLLERQQHEPGFHAYGELSQAAGAFEQIISTNFPDVPTRPLSELARYFSDTLQKQVPVGRMSGGVNQRLVRQFRMPGFPLVLVTTDVLQEGEDLHTFCRRIVHYGIAWTPSAMEQRTGRIDRIGGLVQRRLDGMSNQPPAEELIQVYYPHLRDTVELLQVRHVLGRLDKFLRLIHRGGASRRPIGRTINADRAILEEVEDRPPVLEPLESAFPIQHDWMIGELDSKAVVRPDWNRQIEHLELLWQGLCSRYGITPSPSSNDYIRSGEIAGNELIGGAANMETGENVHTVKIGLRSQVTGEQTLIECECTIGQLDLQDDTVVDFLLDVLPVGEAVKLCVDPRTGPHDDRLYVRREILFDSAVTRLEGTCAMFESTLLPAIAIQASLDEAGLLGARDN